MRTRKSTAAGREPNPPPPGRVRKKSRIRPSKEPYTHFEVRRGIDVILRIAVADDALADVGDELGALVKRIAPRTQTAVIEPAVEPTPEPEPAFVFGRTHTEHDIAYHAELRGHLVDLFGSLCDSALETALDVARQERDRRAEGGN